MKLPEYERHDGLGLAELVRRGEVHPTELAEAAIERIEARNPELNAVVHPMYEEGLRRASGALADGPFRGVPLLLKDLMASYAGAPLTGSCRFLEKYVAPHDSELVIRQRRAGFVVLGRTNTPELGIMGVTEPLLHGPTRNPWNLDHTPGGSSGGSAAAVAAGMVPIGHGGDGGGSIRIPASCTALFGLKPSRGRNPLGPDYGEGWGGMVQEHALTRSVRDSAALLDATHGPDAGAPYHAPGPERPFLEEVGRDPGRLRIAFTTRSIFGSTLHEDCKAAVLDAARLLESLGHDVEEAHPPCDKQALRRSYLTVTAVAIAHLMDVFRAGLGREPQAEDFEPETWFLGQVGRTLGGADYLQAIEDMHQAGRKLAPFFAQYDLLLTSTLAHPPPRIGAFGARFVESAGLRLLRSAPVPRLLKLALFDLADERFEVTANTMLFNQSGQPAMSVPLWWNADGLPIGVQLAGRYAEEGTLLRVAAQLEQARPWFDRRPLRYGY